jgi:hypothetical protein
MRTELEKKLAILSFLKDKLVIPEYNFFGDNNHKAYDIAIECLKGQHDYDDIYAMCDTDLDDEWSEPELTDGEKDIVIGVLDWMDCSSGEELIELLFDEGSLVTELPTESDTCKPKFTICPNLCKECPFSKESPKSWIADYKPSDFQKYMTGEVSFPCHMQMPDVDTLSPEACKEAIANGEAKLCRGYVESIIKSCKSIRDNEQLKEAIEIVKAQGLSDKSMPIWEFVQHHSL